MVSGFWVLHVEIDVKPIYEPITGRILECRARLRVGWTGDQGDRGLGAHLINPKVWESKMAMILVAVGKSTLSGQPLNLGAKALFSPQHHFKRSIFRK